MPVSHGILLRALITALAPAFLLAPGMAFAGEKVRIGQLNDLAFGILPTVSVDQIASDNLCVYSTSATHGYRVTVTGNGPTAAFVMTSGNDQLPFDVQWAFSSGQTTGTSLTPGVALAGTTSNDSDQNCSLSRSASLIAVVRATDNGAATAGTYSGSLTILVAPN